MGISISLGQSFKRLVSVIAIIGLTIYSLPFGRIQTAQAGAISSASWTLSSTTESATSVTYTHTFTTATDIPSGGQVNITIMSPPGPMIPMPQFGSDALATGSTVGLLGVTPSINGFGSTVNITATTDAAISAGTITMKFAGVTNPTSGGTYGSNTSTSTSTGSALDGNRFGPDTNAKFTVGTVKLSGKISDATSGNGIEGIPVEVHPGPNSTSMNGFWKTTTDSSGNYSFAGITNGTFVFEMSPGIDPGSSKAATISQYARFEQVEVTITDTPQTINKSLAKSNKKITGKVVRAKTGVAVVGAQANIGCFGGGFSNAQTDSTGAFTLTSNCTGASFVMVQPPMQGPGGQGGPGGQPGQQQQQQAETDYGAASVQVSFVKAQAEAETIDVGNIEVKTADATVTGTIQNPDGSVATGGAGLQNFKEHSFAPLQLSNGTFSTKVIAGTYKLDSFDPSGNYSLPKTSITAKSGKTINIGVIKKVANDKTITITATRTDTGAGMANTQCMIFPQEEGPPYFATTNSSGVCTVNVPTGFTGRAGVMPGGNFGGGKEGGKPQEGGGGGQGGQGGPGGPGDQGGPGGPGGGENGPVGFFKSLVTEAFAQEQQGGQPNDLQQLFPRKGFQKVSAGDSITAEFDKADKALNVRTVDSNGVLVTQGGFVDMTLPSGFHLGCRTAGGMGTCYSIAGDIKARVMFPPDSSYAGKSKTVSITENNQSVSLEVVEKTVTVTGNIQDGSNSNAVIKDATLSINVGAFGSDGFFMGRYNPEAGTYSISIPPSSAVRLGVMAGDPGRGVDRGGYVPNISPDEVSGTGTETITKNLTLSKVDATINVTVKDSNGTIVEGANVVASNALADIVGPEGAGGPGGPGRPGGPRPEEGPDFGFAGVTDENGVAAINVAPDTYNIVVKAPDLFPTSVTQVSPASGETKDVTVTLAAADSTLKIEVNKGSDNSDLNDAITHVFDDGGKTNLTVTDGDADSGDQDGTVNGIIEVKVPTGTYNIQAGKDFPDSGKVEESGYDKVVTQKDGTVTQTLTTSNQDNALQQPVTSEVSSSSSAALALPDGNTISIPQGALISTSSSSEDSESSSSSGNPVVALGEIKAGLPETKTDTPIGAGVSIDAVDADGNAVTSLQGVISGDLHYKDSDIPSGISEDNFKVKSYNEATGVWDAVQQTAVDTTNNVVSFTTNHLTDFAIVTSTDTTAPAAPTSITATDAKTDGAINLAWTNPTDTDFSKIRVYRSTTSGSIGSVIATTTISTTTSYSDTSLTNGTTYYYTVRALDTSDNESTNTDQVSAAPSATVTASLPKTGPEPMNTSPLVALILLAGLVSMGFGIRHNAIKQRS